MSNFHKTLYENAVAYEDSKNAKKLWVRPKRAIGNKRNCFGWICGNPVLPSSAKWPRREDHPYDFVCQINCEKIPNHFWKGLGPKNGWLSVFFAPTTEKHPFDTKVIYSSEWGLEVKSPEPHHLAQHQHIAKKYQKYLLPDLALELTPFFPDYRDGKPVLPKWTLARPFDREKFLLRDAKRQPTDWDELEVLLSVAIDVHEKAYPKRIKMKQDLERKKEPSENDVSNLAFVCSWLGDVPKILEVLSDELKKIKKLRESHSFVTASWTDLYLWLDEIMGARFSVWHFQYDAVRNQRVLYKTLKSTNSVPPAVKQYFDTVWQYLDDRTIFQIGGGPVGFSSSLFENALFNVFLFNASSSPVHALDFHGSSLNVSVPMRRLIFKNFEKISSDISN